MILQHRLPDQRVHFRPEVNRIGDLLFEARIINLSPPPTWHFTDAFVVKCPGVSTVYETLFLPSPSRDLAAGRGSHERGTAVPVLPIGNHLNGLREREKGQGRHTRSAA